MSQWLQGNAFQLAGDAPTVQFVGATNNTSAGTTWTFTDHPIGAPNANRLVVVVAYASGSILTSISSVTIGGVSATVDVDLATPVNNGPMGIASLAVSSGTTATIVVNAGGFVGSRCRIAVYAIYGSGVVPSIRDADQVRNASSTSASRTLTVSAGDVLIAGMGLSGTNASLEDITWTNATENDENNTGSADRDMSVASADITSGSSVTVTGTISTAFENGLVAATYQRTAASSATITVTSSAVTLTGSSVNLKMARAITATTSAVTLSGTSVNLKAALKILASTAAVTTTGSSVNLRAALRIAANTAAVTTAGTSVNLKRGLLISVSSAAVTLAGTSVALSAARSIAANTSAVTLTGSSVDLTYLPAGAKVITVTGGAVTLTGSEVTLTYSSVPVPVTPDDRITGGGSWRGTQEPRYRVHEEYDDSKKTTVKRIKLGKPGSLEADNEVITGIVEVRPAWDVMVELQQQRDEAERARLERLKAIIQADDEWLMVA